MKKSRAISGPALGGLSRYYYYWDCCTCRAMSTATAMTINSTRIFFKLFTPFGL